MAESLTGAERRAMEERQRAEELQQQAKAARAAADYAKQELHDYKNKASRILQVSHLHHCTLRLSQKPSVKWGLRVLVNYINNYTTALLNSEVNLQLSDKGKNMIHFVVGTRSTRSPTLALSKELWFMRRCFLLVYFSKSVKKKVWTET